MSFFKRKKVALKSNLEGVNGWGKPTRYHWTDRSKNLPSGGAAAYSFDTLQLPTYSPIGWGIIPYKGYQYETPQVAVAHGVIPNSLGNPGILTGQMVNGSLISRTSRNQNDQLPAPEANAFSNVIRPGALS